MCAKELDQFERRSNAIKCFVFDSKIREKIYILKPSGIHIRLSVALHYVHILLLLGVLVYLPVSMPYQIGAT
jgi:hypothetical protein